MLTAFNGDWQLWRNLYPAFGGVLGHHTKTTKWRSFERIEVEYRNKYQSNVRDPQRLDFRTRTLA